MGRSNTEEKSDNELIKSARSGNAEAFSELMGRYDKKLTAYLRRSIGTNSEIHDLLQDIFIKVYRNLEKFDISKKFSSWIYRIAHNETVNYLKKRNRRMTIQLEDFMSYGKWKEDGTSEMEEVIIMQEDQERAKELLEKLPRKYKEIMKAKYIEGKSYQEISKKMGIPVNTVGTLISRAKKKLRDTAIKR